MEARKTISLPTPHGVGKVSNILSRSEQQQWKGQTNSTTPPSITSPPHKSAWNTQSSTDWDNEDIECLDDVMNLATDDDKLREF